MKKITSDHLSAHFFLHLTIPTPFRPAAACLKKIIIFDFFLNFYQPKKHLDVNEFGVVTNLRFLSTAKTRNFFFLSFTLFQSHASDSRTNANKLTM